MSLLSLMSLCTFWEYGVVRLWGDMELCVSLDVAKLNFPF